MGHAAMSAQMMAEILDHYHGPANHKMWLLAWADHADDETRSGWCPRTQLAKRVGVSLRTVTRIAAALVEAGTLKREGLAYHGHSAVYVLGDLNGCGSGTPSMSPFTPPEGGHHE
jgi:hypothetical protein